MGSNTTRLLAFALVLLVTGCVRPGRAQTLSEHLKPIAWMVGDWIGYEKVDDSTTDQSSALQILMHVSAAANGQAITYDVSFRSNGTTTPKYHGTYFWHPVDRAIRVQQINNEGNLAEGVYEPHDSTATQLVRVLTPNQSFSLRSNWQIAPDHFRFIGYFQAKEGQSWQPAVDATYRRVTDGK